MEFKKFKMRLGEYHKHPNNCDLKTFSLPVDTLFFTRGDDDIGNGKHVGALHYLCLTKATDEELKKHMKSLERYILCHFVWPQCCVSYFTNLSINLLRYGLGENIR